MSLISVSVLITVLFHLELNTECKSDSIVTIAGCNVSLKWTLLNTSLHDIMSFKIYNSYPRVIAETAANKCIVVDNSSTYCNIHDCDKALTVSLTILKLTERENGNYTLRLQKGWEGVSSSTKMLVVIGKPKIIEAGKPILGKPFTMTCNLPQEIECMIYRWKINGIQTNNLWKSNSHFVSSVLMTDDLSQVTCQVCLNETSGNISRVICKQDGCSTESDAYTIQVIYGPDNISLSLNESEFYLVEHEPFTIDCLANCNPNCTFWWNGHDSAKSRKLVIPSFESKMAGNYTCYVKNQQTNITRESNPITLHYVKGNPSTTAKIITSTEGNKNSEGMGVIGMGLVGVAVLLVVMGILLVIQCLKNASNKTVANHRMPTNGEMSQGIPRIQNRPLPVPNRQETASSGPYRQKYPHHKRKSRSLDNLLDTSQNSFYPLRGDLSLQVLYSHANIMGREIRNGIQGHNSIKKKRFFSCEENQTADMSGTEDGIELEFLNTKVRTDKKSNRDEHSDVAKTQSLSNSRHESFEEDTHENLYCTIDEDALSDYDDAKQEYHERNVK